MVKIMNVMAMACYGFIHCPNLAYFLEKKSADFYYDFLFVALKTNICNMHATERRHSMVEEEARHFN